jgi:probable HAF family extracellular repeat protein
MGKLGRRVPGHAAAVFSNGSGTLLNLHLPPGIPSQGNAISDSGELTGLLYHEDETILGFLYTNKAGTEIAPLSGDQYSFGNSINASAQIVGVSLGIIGQHHAFLCTPGQGSVNLNSLLPKGSGWTITDATAINDKGQIAGWGINALGFRRAYLLSPVLLPFSGLYASADQVNIRKPAFSASGRITLGANSNGIYPVTETVVLELGGYHISIPPSSFVERYGIYYLSRHNRQCRHRSSSLAHCTKEFFIHHRRRRCNGSAIRFLIVVGFDNRR